MPSLLGTNRRRSMDRPTASVPSSDRLQPRSTSLASHSPGIGNDVALPTVVTSQTPRSHGEDDEEIVDIGFPSSRSFPALHSVTTAVPSTNLDDFDSKTPTRETVNQMAFSFPPNELAAEENGGQGDTAIALAPPTPTSATAFRRKSGEGLGDAADETSTQSLPMSTIGTRQPAEATTQNGHALREQTATERKMALRLEHRRSEFYARPTAGSSMVPPLPTGHQLPHAQSPSSSRPGHRARAASSSVIRAGHPDPAPLAARAADSAVVRRKTSTRNRLRRRASALGGLAARVATAEGHRSESDGRVTTDTPEATASSSGEGHSGEFIHRSTLGRRSSKSQREPREGDKEVLRDAGGRPLVPRQDSADGAAVESSSRQPDAVTTRGSTRTGPSLTADAEADREERRHRRKALALARDGEAAAAAEATVHASTSHREPSRAMKHSKRSVGREREGADRAPVEMTLPNAKVARAPKACECVSATRFRPANPRCPPAMYFYQMPYHGMPPPQPLRAHTATLVGHNIYVVGGTDTRRCWEGVAKFDTGA
jgi:hypothetical protein